ncbi:glycosyltransferase family 2 protein [Fimbriiglobus ruber]|uniref:Putative Glycosyl transferase, family 2 n=1 Tax=Fimbriiglobus ruber TaxID=1908690 RepID=A0A225DCN5_9BACT|nr:glycosyltransferase family 2 protein [Fimbriiglobus ruber]OWK34155.1 putative Glycosyl transferase, family 2 [Fimbriiglobus ruber]
MALTLELLAWAAAVVVAIPLLLLAAETLAAAVRRLRIPPAAADRPRLAVLIPAHNEEDGLSRTLTDVMAQLRPGDRCVVVADNCSDQTAAVARSYGAEVVERSDAVRRGKGYALDAGIRHLSADPPAVLAVIDADCGVGNGALDALAAAAGFGRPVQGINVLYPPPGSGAKARVSAYAFFLKNVIRPLGLSRLGGPCHLFGTGLALPWGLLRHTRLASGNIVEDLQLGVDLTLAGHPPRFLAVPCVTGEFPTGDAAAGTQRRRWEHGHVRTLLRQAPRLVVAGLTRRRPGLVLLGLDLAVPPLSLLGLATLAAAVLAIGAWWLTGAESPIGILLTAIALMAAGQVLAWLRHGRSWIGLFDLVQIPLYVARKFPIYLGLVFRPQQAWVRAARATKATVPADPEPVLR